MLTRENHDEAKWFTEKWSSSGERANWFRKIDSPGCGRLCAPLIDRWSRWSKIWMRRTPSLHQSTMLIDHLGLECCRARCCNKLRADYHNSKVEETWQQRKLMIVEDANELSRRFLRFLNRSIASEPRSECSKTFLWRKIIDFRRTMSGKVIFPAVQRWKCFPILFTA